MKLKDRERHAVEEINRANTVEEIRKVFNWWPEPTSEIIDAALQRAYDLGYEIGSEPRRPY